MLVRHVNFFRWVVCDFFFRRITTVNRYLADQGHDIAKVWKDIDDVIIKTIISAMPTLRHNYRTCFPNHVRGSACFEISGFDIILDKKLKPFVLEVRLAKTSVQLSVVCFDEQVKESFVGQTVDFVVSMPAGEPFSQFSHRCKAGQRNQRGSSVRHDDFAQLRCPRQEENY